MSAHSQNISPQPWSFSQSSQTRILDPRNGRVFLVFTHAFTFTNMDILVAIGLAGNIIQFVDFGGKLISKTAEIYKSSTGALVENVDIETATNNLVLLSTTLQDSA